GLRILQFLKQEANSSKDLQVDNLKDNLLYFSSIDNEYSSQLADLSSSANLNELSSLENLRDTLANFEYSLRKLKAKY
ncbi:MAG: hypothetical protein J7K39_12515, partial [Bacteroidales bacterium]|nr:hypothetical protein [Bacteroidales bacterium]